MRRASEHDVDDLVRLWQLALDEMQQFRGGALYGVREARSRPVDRSFTAELRSDDHATWVGALDGVTLGFASVRAERLQDARRLAVIEELFVEPEARAIGLGEKIMDEVLAWSSERDCVGVDAYALPGARDTKNFFEMSGFTARLLVMHHTTRK